ncbi:MAG TPA: M13 family metallopeptidase [Anaeromyxobacteraceae bacterium]|nr:M13 family metallopeptidase [Anaeromyxobacteraceae bacterium]
MNHSRRSALAAVALAAVAGAACRTASAPSASEKPASAAAPAAVGTPPSAAKPAEAPPPTQAEAAPQRGAPGIDVSIVDRKVDPCDDFYAFACGGWLARTEIPADQPIWSRSFMEIRERNLAALREIAEAEAAGRSDPEDRYPGKVGDYYASCIDEAAVEARGVKDLQAMWKRIDGVKDAAALGAEIGSLHRQGVWPLFHLYSDQDARDATRVIGIVFQGGLSLPDRDYYVKDDEKSAAIRASLVEHVERQLALGGMSQRDAKAAAGRIAALEKRLAEAQWQREELRDPERIYNPLDVGGLRKASPRFPWQRYLTALGHPDLSAFSASTPKYLARIDELLGSVPMQTWRDYLKFRTASALAAARAAPKAMVDEDFRFGSTNFTGAKELEPRWKHCVDMTDEALGEALGQAWVRRHFGADAKAKTNQLVADVEAAMGRDLDRLAWMDDATRDRAREKLGRIENKVGYPDAWRNYDRLQVSRESFAANFLAGEAFEVNRDLSKIGKPVDRNEWLMTPPMVNAYYSAPMNEMAFPAGIMQPPFYTRGAPDAVNLGAIGMAVGHELTHGFDDEGRRYDANGNLTDWWTPSVAQEFDRRAECVVEQYAGYVADPAIADVKLNGKLTLGENIADLGGLKLAFSAYQASRAGKAPEAIVGGFTPEQAFFLGYAQSWCTKIRPEYARVRAVTDPHAPPLWRVNGPLSNLTEFQGAFQCRPGARMVRAERCEVW